MHSFVTLERPQMSSQPHSNSNQTSPTESRLQREDYRISTFRNWPAEAARIDARKIAKAGLFHADTAGEIRCSWCGFNRQFNHIEQDDEVILEHVSESPDCRFVAIDPIRSPASTSTASAQSCSVAAECPSSPAAAVATTSPLSPRHNSPESNSSGHEEGDLENDDCPIRMGADRFTAVCDSSSTPPLSLPVVGAADSFQGRLNIVNSLPAPTDYSPKRESTRLLTFRRWPVTFISGADLARAGFLYTGDNDTVQCAFCREYVGQWTLGDDPAEEHRKLFPHCPFIQGRPVGNIRIEDELVECQLSSQSSSDLAQPAPSVSGGQDQVPGSEPGTDNESHMNSPQSSLLNRSDSGLGLLLGNMAMGYDETGIRPNYRDTELLNEDHQAGANASGYCEYAWKFVPLRRVTGHDGSYSYDGVTSYIIPPGRQSNESSNMESDERNGSTEDVEVIESGTSMVTGDDDLSEAGITSHAGPAHSKHATKEARLRTFLEWPPALRQQPEDLADAGFFYTGKSDQVRCFYCDGGLRNWQPEDCPWVEHARWFSGCGFVRLVKGNDFVEQCMAGQSGSSRKEEDPMTAGGADLDQCLARISSDVARSNLDTSPTRNRSPSTIQTPPACGTSSDSTLPSRSRSVDASRASLTPEAAVKGSLSVPSGSGRQALHPSADESSSSQDEDYHDLKAKYNRLKEERMCKVCYDQDIGIVFVPCGHCVCCVQCALALSDCPVCRKPIRGTVKTYNY